MAGGRDGEQLLAVVRELYGELGYAGADGAGESWLREAGAGPWQAHRKDTDGLVARLRAELARLAHAAHGESGPPARERRAVQAALDGAELVMRAEIAAEQPERIGELLPGFAYIVALSGLGRDGALRISRRAAELVAASEG